MSSNVKRILSGRVFAVLAALGLMAAPLTASAGFIQGAITFSGDFVPTGGSGADLSDATGIDFLGDDFDVDGATGDFALAGIGAGDIGFMQDFQFNPLNPSPVDPLWAIAGFEFALHQIAVDFQNASFLVLFGHGVLSGPGLLDTNGTWALSANMAPGATSLLFNFSAGSAAVPVPGTLLLVGIGLAGFAAARRRRV